jgi:hypothetical protein
MSANEIGVAEATAPLDALVVVLVLPLGAGTTAEVESAAAPESDLAQPARTVQQQTSAT